MFFTKLQQVCDEHGISVSALLDSLELSRGNIARWKTGLEPKPSTKSKIAEALNVSIDVFDDPQKIIESELSFAESSLLINFRKLSCENQEAVMQIVAQMALTQKNSAVPDVETAR